MTDLLLTLIALWLLGLTVAFVGVVRHLGVIQAASVGGKAPEGGWLFDTDGPWIPSTLPDRAVQVFRNYDIETDDLIVTFFSSGCGTCLEIAEEIAGSRVDSVTNVFLITGSNPNLIQAMNHVLSATGALCIVDPDAHDVVKSLDINSTPFTFRIMNDEVVAKAFVRTVDDYLRMNEPRVPGGREEPLERREGPTNQIASGRP